MLGPELDTRLIDLLKQDARLSTTALARRLGVARSTVQSRLDRLEQSGTILGYTLRLAQPPNGSRIQAHVSIRVQPKHQAAVERRLAKLGGIETLHTVSGAHDLIALVQAESTAELDLALDAIRDTEGVVETNSAIILSTRVSR